MTSYLLTAERLAEKLDDRSRTEVYAEMAREIVRGVHDDLNPVPERRPPRTRSLRRNQAA